MNRLFINAWKILRIFVYGLYLIIRGILWKLVIVAESFYAVATLHEEKIDA